MKKLSQDDALRIAVCLEMYGVELSDLSLYEIDEYVLKNKPSDEELYAYVLDKIDLEMGLE